MSGGSYDYLCYKIDDAANILMAKHQPDYRRAFGKHLRLIAKAMHDVEWVDSCDMSNGDDKKSIMLCIGHEQVLKELLNNAIKIRDELIELLEIINKEKLCKNG